MRICQIAPNGAFIVISLEEFVQGDDGTDRGVVRSHGRRAYGLYFGNEPSSHLHEQSPVYHDIGCATGDDVTRHVIPHVGFTRDGQAPHWAATRAVDKAARCPIMCML